jgi:formamidopyrimidine-DNA glycosylase
VRRRGKYLLIDLDQGVLLLHLGMSGSLRFDATLPPPGTARPLRPGHRPRHAAPERSAPLRRRGLCGHEAAPWAIKLLGGLGVEPLGDDFDLDAFHAGLKKRKAPIKQVLLAGDVVVGVGNIYASEALFQAGIRPTLSAARISRPRAAKLHAAVREVLARAVEKGGSTLRDFSGVDGKNGYFQLEAMVYGRAGEPCRVCGTPIRTIRQGSARRISARTARKAERRSCKGADAIFVSSFLHISLGYILQRTIRPARRMAAQFRPAAEAAVPLAEETTSCSTSAVEERLRRLERRCAPTRSWSPSSPSSRAASRS